MWVERGLWKRRPQGVAGLLVKAAIQSSQIPVPLPPAKLHDQETPPKTGSAPLACLGMALTQSNYSGLMDWLDGSFAFLAPVTGSPCSETKYHVTN
jgi:hypothetical protein